MNGKRQTRDTLIAFIQEHLSNEQLDCSEVVYKDRHTNVTLCCPTHGKFSKLPNEIFNRKSGCPRCGIIKRNNKNLLDTADFISNAKLIHGNKYNYETTIYRHSQKKLTIVCPEHGPFQQTPTNHTQGQGCPLCYKQSKKGTGGGYSFSYFECNPKKAIQPAMLYVIHMTCETDNFIKVGITKRKIHKRFSRKGEGQKYISREVLHTKYMSLLDAFTLEQTILKDLKDQQYWPNYVFDGRTECLKNTPAVLDRIKQLIQ
jgi:hypothetical protein